MECRPVPTPNACWRAARRCGSSNAAAFEPPRWVDASAPDAKPCPGWPIVVKQEENGLPNTGLKLALLTNLASGSLIEVHRTNPDEHVYTFRAVVSSFAPPVWTKGEYHVIVRDPAGRVVKRSTESV